MSTINKPGNKNSKRRKDASSHNAAEEFSRMDYLAAIPGFLMCTVTLLMLLADIVMPEMAQAQYRSYPAIFRGADLVISAAGIIYFCIYIKNRKFDNLRASCIFFCLFIVCIILSTAVNGLDSKAVHGVSFRDIGVFNIISFILIYMGLSSLIGSLTLRRFVLFFYIITADLTALAAAADRWLIPIPAFGEKKDISAIFFNGNHYGYFLVMAILLSAGLFLYSPALKIKILGVCSLVLNGIILTLNGSTGCVLAVSVSLVLTLAITLTMYRSALKINLILLCVLAGALVILTLSTSMLQTLTGDIISIITGSGDSGSAGHNRWLLWTTVCEYISSKPLLGYGCEGLSDILMETTGRADPHNEILSYASQFGIPAAVFYTVGAVLTLAEFFKVNVPDETHAKQFSPDAIDETRAACFLAASGYFISSLFGVTMFYTLPFFFIFLGLSKKAKTCHKQII